RQRSRVQEIPPRQPVTQVHRLLCVQSDHCRFLVLPAEVRSASVGAVIALSYISDGFRAFLFAALRWVWARIVRRGVKSLPAPASPHRTLSQAGTGTSGRLSERKEQQKARSVTASLPSRVSYC